MGSLSRVFVLISYAAFIGCGSDESPQSVKKAPVTKPTSISATAVPEQNQTVDLESSVKFELRGAKLLAGLKRGATSDFERYYENAIKFRERTRGGNLDAYAVVSYVGTQAAEKFDEYKSRVDNWISLSPNHVVPYVIRAEMNYRKAWKTRGHGYAAAVGKEAWVPFQQSILSAKSDLDKALTINPKDPVALVMMIDVARVMGAPVEGIRHFFERAVKEVPNYYQAYAEMSIALSPQWGGSIQDQITFLRPEGSDLQTDITRSIIFVDILRDHVRNGRLLPREVQLAVKWESLRGICDAATKTYPTAGLYGAWCGELAASLAEHDDAKRFLQKAAQADPDNEAVHSTIDRVRRKYRTPV